MLKKMFVLVFFIINLNAEYYWYLNNKVQRTQEALNASYSKLIKTGLVNESLTINVNPSKKNFKSEGLKLLELIQILENNPTKQSIIVLDKLHNLYYLEFYKFIKNLKCLEEEKIELSLTLSDLFLPNLKQIDLQTFNIRNTITKAFIQMIIINKTFSFHQTRKDAIQLLFNQTKQEILNEKEINKKTLDKFIKILNLNAAQPLVSKTTKRLIIASTVLLTITTMIILYWNPYIKSGMEKIKTKTNELHESLINKLILDINRILNEAINTTLNQVRTNMGDSFVSRLLFEQEPENNLNQQNINEGNGWLPWWLGGGRNQLQQ